MHLHLNLSAGGVARGGRVAVWVAVAIAVRLTLGCTPYPVYTHSGNDPGMSDHSDGAAERGGVWTQETEFGEESYAVGYDVPPSNVDPRVFARVVEMYLGIPYKKGGRTAEGIDCSNLASALHQDYSGRKLPASTRALYKLPDEVGREYLQVGDLVFFSFGGGRPTHVGVYTGEGRFVHASESRGVIYSSLETPYYRDAFRGARRVL
jgi:cell wall-associated NlpC family hydrolase